MGIKLKRKPKMMLHQQESILPDLPMYGEGELFPDWDVWLKKFNTIATENMVAIAAKTIKKKAKKLNPFVKAKVQKKTPFSRSHKKKKELEKKTGNNINVFISKMTSPVVEVKKAPPAPPPSQESSMGISFDKMAADWYAKEKGIVLVFGDRGMFSMCCGNVVGSIKLSQHSFYSSNRFALANYHQACLSNEIH
jgi:hypothetical protein